MEFEKGNLYHIYNQGNNQRKIFFEKKNYLFFLKKVRTYISPYADILAWCLMPNHFHLMIRVNEVELATAKESHTMTLNQTHESHRMTSPEHDLKSSNDLLLPKSQPTRTLNNSIAILLRSYTRAINLQENMSGSLFKAHTKAQCLNCLNSLTPSFYEDDGVTKINITDPYTQYPQNCFDYIHQNPVKARLANKATDWEFSSAKDYTELRKGNLVNMKVALQYVDINL